MVIDDPVLILRIPRTFRAVTSPESLYEATRGVWRVGPRRNAARYALGVAEGVVQEVYEIHRWQPAGTAPYATRTREDVARPSRWEFVGQRAPEGVRAKYLGRPVPEFSGGQNPVRYVNCEA